MKSIRSMVLVSTDPASVERGAEAIFRALQAEIRGSRFARRDQGEHDQ